MSGQQHKAKKVSDATESAINALNQYPGMDAFAKEQVDSVLQSLTTAQNLMHQMLAFVTSISQHNDRLVALVGSLQTTVEQKPFNALFNLGKVSASMDVAAMENTLRTLANNGAQFVAAYQEAVTLSAQASKTVDSIIKQAEQAVPDDEEPATQSTGVPSSYYQETSTPAEGFEYV